MLVFSPDKVRYSFQSHKSCFFGFVGLCLQNLYIYLYQWQRTSQDDVNTVNVSMRMKFNFFLNNKFSLLN